MNTGGRQGPNAPDPNPDVRRRGVRGPEVRQLGQLRVRVEADEVGDVVAEGGLLGLPIGLLRVWIGALLAPHPAVRDGEPDREQDPERDQVRGRGPHVESLGEEPESRNPEHQQEVVHGGVGQVPDPQGSDEPAPGERPLLVAEEVPCCRRLGRENGGGNEPHTQIGNECDVDQFVDTDAGEPDQQEASQGRESAGYLLLGRAERLSFHFWNPLTSPWGGGTLETGVLDGQSGTSYRLVWAARPVDPPTWQARGLGRVTYGWALRPGPGLGRPPIEGQGPP